MTLSRRASRRTALFLLYQWDVTGQPLSSLYEGEIDEFALETAEGVAAEADDLDTRITEATVGWTADRLGAVERNVLRLAWLVVAVVVALNAILVVLTLLR